MGLGSDRPHALREMIDVCRPAGTLSAPGVYGGLIDKVPFGAAMNKDLTIRTGQNPREPLDGRPLNRIQEGQIDPSFVIIHTASLAGGPDPYEVFRNKEDSCVKVVLKP